MAQTILPKACALKKRSMRRLAETWKRFKAVRFPLLRLLAPWLLLLPLMTYLLYQRLYEDASAPLYHQLRSTLAEAGKFTARELGNVQRDGLLLTKLDIVRKAASQPDTANRQAMETLLIAFSEASSRYDQIRWVSETGKELVRVDLVGKHAVAVPPDKLRPQAGRYYIKEGLLLAPGEFYISPMDLNIESGIQHPWKPELRVVTPVVDLKGRKRGMLVLNFLSGKLLGTLRNIGHSSGVELSLLNKEGYWLLAPQQQDAWGFMFHRDDLRLAVTDPYSWAHIESTVSGTFVNQSGLWSFQTVKLAASGNNVRQWKLVGRIPRAQLNVVVRKSALQSVFAAACLLMLAFAGSWRIAMSMLERDLANRALHRQHRELERANQALAASLQRLQDAQNELVQAAKLSSLGMMVAGVAHELNTPVGAALVTLSSLRNDNTALSQAFDSGLRRSDMEVYFARFTEGAEILQSNLIRAAELVRSFKQLAADRSSEERRRFKLTALVEDLLHTTWSRMNKQAHALYIDVDDSIELESYPGALGRVLENLVSNALLHAFGEQQSGSITVAALWNTDGHSVVITVCDTGAGIPEQELLFIFDPFFTTRRGSGGTGLGLHLVHQLVTQVLGGTIQVESTVGQGTCFTLTIPSSEPDGGQGKVDKLNADRIKKSE